LNADRQTAESAAGNFVGAALVLHHLPHNYQGCLLDSNQAAARSVEVENDACHHHDQKVHSQ
jgi:hypothetical protein